MATPCPPDFGTSGILRPGRPQRAQSIKRPAADRRADQRVPVDDGLYEFVVRSVERRWRQPDRRRRAGFCAGAGREPAVGYRASLQFRTRTPAPRQTFDQRWSAWGSAYRRAANSTATPWSAPAMSRRAITASPPERSPRHAGFAVRLCARRRRHQLERGGKSRHRAERQLPGWRATTPPIGGRSICPVRWLSLITGSRPTASRSATSSPRSSTARVTRHAAKPATAIAVPVTGSDYRRDALCGGAVPRTSTRRASPKPISPAAGCGLASPRKNATDTRSELGARFDKRADRQ